MATLTVQPSGKDTYIWDGAADTNYGDLTLLTIEGSTANIIRSLLQFDISSLPAGAVLTAATLYLYYYAAQQGTPTGRTYNCYRVLRRDWVELEATWNIYKTGSNWTTAGCGNTTDDYTTADGASATVPAVTNWMSWNVLAQVQTAFAGSFEAAFRISDNVEDSATRHQARFYSNNYVGDTSLCPKLIIEYAPNVNVGGGSITPTGTLGLLIKIATGEGSITPAGVLGLLTKISIGAGAVTIAGALGRKILIAVGSGSVTIAGALSTIRYRLLSIASSIASALSITPSKSSPLTIDSSIASALTITSTITEK